jgi:asparagine synthase (glutamine-hydrolysing)
MCGIAGIIRWNGAPQHDLEVERMTAAIAHRGPDGVGFLQRQGVALGHRRLAIIDPALGHQPMSNEDESVWITYNGEMYNYLELKDELRQKGHRFVTNSDTEVVIHAYDEWGTECLRKFRGMFAFAIADFRNRKLFLARDHFGIKPLYYRVSKDYLAFGSELRALREVDDVVPQGSLWAIELYLRYQYIPTPHTIYHNVYKLPPASYLLVDFDGHPGQPVEYWDVNFKAEKGSSDEEWVADAEAVIRDSVKAHLVADVPFGVFLSGGIDSSLVALEMSRILERPVQAFAIGFKEEGYSELAFAEQVAKQCGIELHTQVIEDDSLHFLPELIEHYGEPFGDSSAIPTWYVSRLARERVPMVLSGDGGDEAFGGYGTYDSWMKVHPISRALQDMRTAPRTSFHWARHAIRKRLTEGSWHDLAQWQKTINYVNQERREALWRAEYQAQIGSNCELFQDAHLKGRHNDRLAYVQYLDYRTYLPCDILTKVDVASMYHGLEVRTPLIDLRVVELASRLPLNQRFRSNGSPESIRKYLLKKVLGKDFPPEFIHRKKQGFAIPRDQWFLPGGHPGRKLLEEVLMASDSRLHECFNPDQIQHQLNLHQKDCDNSDTLWLLLVLGIWLDQNPEVSFN